MQTAIYSLPAVTGSHEARFRARWAVNALITSASWEPRMQQLILLGYSPWTPLIRVFSGFSPETLSYVSSDHKDFDDYPGTQTEGIVIFSDGGVYVSSEGVLGNNATLFSITYE
jgi:hypothetical protein